MFEITNGKGFKVTFANGVTLSTQFGVGNYCERGSEWALEEEETGNASSANAEVAVWDRNGKWVTRRMFRETFGAELGDDVIGYVTPEQWLSIVEWCKKEYEEA